MQLLTREVGMKSKSNDLEGMELISFITSQAVTGGTVSNSVAENKGSVKGRSVKLEASLATVICNYRVRQ